MARIRSIKPEFWHDPDMASELSRDQRLLYIGLWNLCFDNWTMEYDPRNVKRELFGYDDDVTPALIDEWVKEIAATGRIEFFEFEGRTCIYLPKCVEHQSVNKPTRSPIPAPVQVVVREDYGSIPVALHDGKELGTGKGKELGGDARAREDAPPSFDECYEAYPLHRFEAEAREAFDTLSAPARTSLLAACRNAPRNTKQSLGRFVTEKTWRDFLPRIERERCHDPDCVNGWVFVEAVEACVPCEICKRDAATPPAPSHSSRAALAAGSAPYSPFSASPRPNSQDRHAAGRDGGHARCGRGS